MLERSTVTNSQPSPESIEVARRVVVSQLPEEYKGLVSDERLMDVARWLNKGWGVRAYYQEAEWREDGVGDDITYGGLVIEPVASEKEFNSDQP